ncbi:hypothetical protein [Actinomycetospora straminea]|uniref:SPW repeat-containing protein n=1 Tax=Actinomycetospora straminea TaxID=663607 RepID=A0ABP9EJ53_9PSEU|nr:hypothetical protein [Actinomycetospora straminea]MDD7933176.1 hypothetical protein [Actinomycetospora straminea]
MRRRDVAAGLLVLAAVLVWLLGTTTVLAPFDGVRGSALLVTALGVAAEVVGGAWRGRISPAAMRGPAALGLVTAIVAVVTVVSGSPAGLFVLVLLTVVLWMLATLRHLTGPR